MTASDETSCLFDLLIAAGILFNVNDSGYNWIATSEISQHHSGTEYHKEFETLEDAILDAAWWNHLISLIDLEDDSDDDRDYDDSMDGDFDSGMASAGFGTDEDYGYYGGED